MKKDSLLLLFILFLSFNFYGQELDLKWSSITSYSNRKDGFFDGFVGSSETQVYGIYKDYESRLWHWNRNKFEMSLVAFDKQTMRKTYQAPLKSRKHDKARMKKMRDHTYVGTLVLKEVVYVFWKKSTATQTDIFAETFDVYLNRTSKISRIYSVKHSKSKKAKSRGLFKRNAVGNLAGVPIVIQTNVDSTKIMLGAEIQHGKDEQFEFDYLIVDTKFQEINKGHVKLPAVQMSRYNSSFSAFTFQYGKDDNIYIKGVVRLSKAERQEAKKGESSAYSILCILNPSDASLETYTMKYDDKNVFNFDYITNEEGVKLYGFFNDIEKDPKGSKTHGIFYSSIMNGEMQEPTFSYFDAKTLKELYKDDPNEKKNGGSKRKRSIKKLGKINDDESLDESYVIETAQAIDDENIVLFCSKVFNYTVTSCSSNGAGGGTTCVTNYYCRKRNVTAFKIDNAGEIVWASNVDREKTYSGWNIKDLKIVSDKDKFYVIYGSAYHSDATRLAGKKKKKKKEIRDEFEFAVFDYETGKNKKNEMVVNDKGVSKKERKYISPTDIQVLDNEFFVNSTRTTLHPLVYIVPAALFVGSVALAFLPGTFAIAAAATTFVFIASWPVAVIAWTKGHVIRGSGHMGTIKLPISKRKKSK